MERKGRSQGAILGAAVAALALVGLLFVVLRPEGGAEEVARIDARSGRLVSDPGGSPGGSGGPGGTGRPATVGADGGVPRPPRGPLEASRVEASRVEASRTVPALTDRPRDPGEGQSSGWRLGQTRRQIEVASTRTEWLRAALADLERRGNAAAVEAQREVVQRFERRLEELRADAATLEARAREDGSLDDAQTGYDATDLELGQRAPARETAATPR